MRRLWAGDTVTHKGAHLDIDAATLPTLPDPVPPLYFGGSSPAAGPVAAEHCDVYLTWGEPVDAVAKKVEWIRGLAAERGRTVKFGIRLHVITRDTADEAWAQAGRLVQALGEDVVSTAQAGLARSESTGQQRMRALHENSRASGDWRDPHSLEVAPNLWAGVGLVRGGAGTALVGSHSEVANRMAEYAAVGIDEFVLSGYPHLEELYWFGEGVIPQLAERGLFSTASAPGSGHTAFLPAVASSS